MLTNAERLKNLEAPKGPVDCVLDTDTFNEVDDQFALSMMVKTPECRVQALYAAPFYNSNSSSPADGMERSYKEILTLLDLMGAEDLKEKTFRGSEAYLPDEKTPVDSDAARHLAALAMRYTKESPLYVVAIGAITNVASAILMQPEIADRIVIVWLGGHDIRWPNTAEFNMVQDIAAARVVFGCGAPLVQLPCMGVVDAFYITQYELEAHLKGQNKLCDYLVNYTVSQAWPNGSQRVSSRVIWDVTAVAWLLNGDGRYLASVIDHAPIPEYDKKYAFDETRHLMCRVTHVSRDNLFNALFDTLRK